MENLVGFARILKSLIPDKTNVLFLTSENEFSGIIYSFLEVGKIFSQQYLVVNLS